MKKQRTSKISSQKPEKAPTPSRGRWSHGALVYASTFPRFERHVKQPSRDLRRFPSAWTPKSARAEFAKEIASKVNMPDADLLREGSAAILALIARRAPETTDLIGLALEALAEQLTTGIGPWSDRISRFLGLVAGSALSTLANCETPAAMETLFDETVAAVNQLAPTATRNTHLAELARRSFFWPSLIANNSSVTPVSEKKNSENEVTLKQLRVGTESAFRTDLDKGSGNRWRVNTPANRWARSIYEYFDEVGNYLRWLRNDAEQRSDAKKVLKQLPPWILSCEGLSTDSPKALWNSCVAGLIDSLSVEERAALAADFKGLLAYRDPDGSPKHAHPSDIRSALLFQIRRALFTVLRSSYTN